jgi:mono/diheme cytochrome c family protein
MSSAMNRSTPEHPGGKPAGADGSLPPAGVTDLAPADPREHIEPGEAHRPISVWVIAFLGTLLFWGGWYVQRYSGGYEAQVYDEQSLGLAGAKSNAVTVIDPYVLGKRLYGDTCAKCHQPDGLGLPGQYPPLSGSEWVLAPGPARMIRIVLDAVQGPIKVKNLEFNNTMTPWRDTLTDQQIAAIVTFVRTQKEWSHNASPVTPEEVAAIRQKTKDRTATGPWTANELLALPEHESPPDPKAPPARANS